MGGGIACPQSLPQWGGIGASILAPTALNIGPPVCESWIRH